MFSQCIPWVNSIEKLSDNTPRDGHGDSGNPSSLGTTDKELQKALIVGVKEL